MGLLFVFAVETKEEGVLVLGTLDRREMVWGGGIVSQEICDGIV